MDALHRCINELCLHCGKYENEHEGACDGCPWYTKKYEPEKSMEQLYKDMVEDLMFYCESRECHSSDDGVCPFLDATTWVHTCTIGTPSEWTY